MPGRPGCRCCQGAVATRCQPEPTATTASPAAAPPGCAAPSGSAAATRGVPSTHTRWPARTPGSATSAVAVAGTSTSAVNLAPLRVNATLTSPRAVGTWTEPLARLAGCGRMSTVPQPGVSADTPNTYCGMRNAGDAAHGWE